MEAAPHDDYSLMLRLFRPIVEALEAAREAGDDPLPAALAVARHLWRHPPPAILPQ